jgi:hypothetical protein
MRKSIRILVFLALVGVLATMALSAAQPRCSSEVVNPTGPERQAPNALDRAALPMAPVGTAYIAATWGDNSVHFLDVNMNNLGSFSTGSNPNGIATDGTHIYVGSFYLPGVYVYDMNGAFLYQWSSGYCESLQGLEYVSGALAVSSSPDINFLSPADGSFIRSIPNQGSTVEGITYDGTYLWQLGDQIIATDPATGAFVRSVPNAALGCSYGGTGLAASGSNELTLGCDGGYWYKVSSVDGSVIASGNNGLSMYGLKHVGSLVTYDRSFTDDSGRSAFCVNTKTGDYQWSILSGQGSGSTFTGKAQVLNGGAKFTSFPGATNTLNFTWDKLKKKAQGYFIAAAVLPVKAEFATQPIYSPLVDKNTSDDPPGCIAPPPPDSPSLD